MPRAARGYLAKDRLDGGHAATGGAESGRDHAKVRDGYFQHNREFATDTYVTCFA